MSDNDFRQVATIDDLKDHPVVPVYLSDLKKRISLTQVEDEVFAFDDLCTRDECPLSAGKMMGGSTIMCQCAGCHFDVTTGQVVKGPATEPLATYPVRVTAKGDIEIHAS